jgi:NADPH:quinone reductase-like Zn-dependent oxidoreductase
MKAIVQHEYGSPDVLHLEEVEKPAPNDSQVQIRILAASVNRSDWEGLTGKPLYARIGGLFRPKSRILGSDIAGRVEMVGKSVPQFKPGDDVFGLLMDYGGGFAEFVCTPEKSLALKPPGMTFEIAAAIPQGALIAVQGIRDKGDIKPGHKVLINGAGGAAGTFAIQLAKRLGAEVTGVDNAEKLDLMRSLGADHVIDYSKEDFTRTGHAYDLILDVVAYRSAFDYARALRPGGKCFVVGGSVATFLQILLVGPWIRRTAGKKISVLVLQPNSKDLVFMAELIQDGNITAVIDKTYRLSEVAEALRYLGEGHAKGKLVIVV